MSAGELRFELDNSKPDPEEVAKLLVEAREARRLEGLGDGGAEALANAMIGCGSKAHTPLTLSLSKGAVGVTKVLLDHGADPNLRNADNKLPLSVAIRKRDEASLSLLIRNGANVFSSVNETSWTPLHLAAATGFLAGCQALVRSFLEGEAVAANAEHLAWELIERRAVAHARRGRLVSTPAMESRVSGYRCGSRGRQRSRRSQRSRSRSRSKSPSRRSASGAVSSSSAAASSSSSPATAAASKVSAIPSSSITSSSSKILDNKVPTEGDVSRYSDFLLRTISKPTALGDSPLHLAVANGRPSCAEYLLRYGADANSIALSSGLAPCVTRADMDPTQTLLQLIQNQSLHLAASKGALDCAKALLSYGADPLMQEQRGARRTPLKIARDFKHRQVATLILNTLEELEKD